MISATVRSMPIQGLVGRAEELAAVDRVVARARDGLSGVLVVRGEPGVGKTALLGQVMAEADARIAHIAGIESEMDMGHAALHMLLTPFLTGLAELPTPQRDALGAAFGLTVGPPPDRFLVGLATLTLLADAAARGPLLCVVDDAQWLDNESADVLHFVARRLQADGIALLLGVRESADEPTILAGLPDLRLRGLPETDARELLKVATGGTVDDQVAARLVADTRANPLALAELAKELTPQQLAGRAVLPDPLPLGRRLEAVFLRRVQAMPPATQTLLLVAAAETSGDLALVWRAAQLLGSGPDAAPPAEAERLLTISPDIQFGHPLIRSAVYHGAQPDQRRRVHTALAAADQDADRRAWHRAVAATGPDEDIAAELEQSAGRAGARGGFTATAKLLTRAVDLTADAGRRPGRLVAAAHATLTAGSPAAASELLAQAAPQLTSPLQRANSLRLRAAIGFARGEAGGPFPLVMEAARALLPLDERLSRDTLFEAFETATWTNREATVQAARAARTWPPLPAAEATSVDLMTEALSTRVLDGLPAAVPLYRHAFTRLLAETQDIRAFNVGSLAAAELWDIDMFLALTSRWVELARAQGAINTLPLALLLRASPEQLSGRLAAALAFNQEAAELSRATTGQLREFGHGPEIGLSLIGPEDQARAAAAAHIREAVELGQELYGTLVPEYSLTQLELGLGNYPAARVRATRILASDTMGPVSAVSLPDLVEAAQRSGDDDTAKLAFARLEAITIASGTAMALGVLARSRALLTGDDGAEPLYLEAIAHLQRSPARPDLARAHLVYGEWLRRNRRRRDARESLRTAHELFETMGYVFFARRARVELAATGERARQRVPETHDELTPQELQIARLAASGVPNREIAARLFISASTVEYHLRKVFRKLEITARGQLRDALGEARSTAPATP
jgi:DNA-binding CsgD family transcriptional regulator